MRSVSAITAILVIFLSGCASNASNPSEVSPALKALHGYLKAVESKAYDQAAAYLTNYCAVRENSLLMQREAVEARRETRQRGGMGPSGPETEIPGLDVKTAHGEGAFVWIFCASDTVPDQLWQGLVRNWR